MSLFEDLTQRREHVCVVGLGYVGLPLAVLLSKTFSVFGFDIDEKKVDLLKQGHDGTGELDSETICNSGINFSVDPSVITRSKFIIVAVPTPVDEKNVPDLTILRRASALVGEHLSKGAIVVFESTVYPGATEEECIPALEGESSLVAGEDFFVGYSPERVNPGDAEHTIDRVTKVVAGMDDQTTHAIAQVYGTITNVFRASSIKVAEAAKVIENTQRDLNIALMNELAILFNKMDINTHDVLEAAGTKWNFLKFTPGLVGGHCIGVDPYYLTYKAESVGHTPEVILAGRGINNTMHKFVARQIIKTMVRMGKDVKSSQFLIYGVTFKENVRDVRNSKVASLYHELIDFGVQPVVYDPLADPAEVEREYGIVLSDKDDLPKADVLIIAVAHDEFKKITAQELKGLMNEGKLLCADLKNIFSREEVEQEGLEYWSL